MSFIALTTSPKRAIGTLEAAREELATVRRPKFNIIRINRASQNSEVPLLSG
jgi:hypothetical protein